jgi:transcriptional regulator with XRE-family HTH domain
MTTAAQRTPTDPVARRFIGRTVREARENSGLSIAEAALKAEISKSMLQRIEEAKPHVRFKPRDFSALLETLRMSLEDVEILMGLTAGIQTGSKNDETTEWWRPYIGSAIPAWFELYLRLEDLADELRIYESELITGLLQKQTYAAKVIGDSLPGLYSDDEVVQRVDARMQRQSLLTRENPPTLKVIMNEAVISRTCGMGPALATEQLQGLVKVSTQPNIDLRIVPFEVGIHGGMTGVAGFTCLRFPLLPGTDKPVEPPLIYSDFPTGSQYQSEPDEVAHYDRIWGALEDKALDPTASREAIRTALGGLS